MKRLKISILALIIALLIPTSAFASTNEITPLGAGVWDTLWEGEMYVTSRGVYTPTVTSGGGDFQVCVFNNTANNKVDITLYEVDGSVNDGVVLPYGHIYTESGCIEYRDIGFLGDGANGKPEFRAKIVSESPEYLYIELND